MLKGLLHIGIGIAVLALCGCNYTGHASLSAELTFGASPATLTSAQPVSALPRRQPSKLHELRQAKRP